MKPPSSNKLWPTTNDYLLDESQITATTGEDNWDSRLTEEEWGRVTAFVQKFQLIRRYVDFVEFQVGGETRRVPINNRGDDKNARGVIFHVPKESLMITVEYGYLDDLLIGKLTLAGMAPSQGVSSALPWYGRAWTYTLRGAEDHLMLVVLTLLAGLALAHALRRRRFRELLVIFLALQGLAVATTAFWPIVVPLTCVILVVLFSVQKRGTAGIGAVFGPVTLCWFAAIAFGEGPNGFSLDASLTELEIPNSRSTSSIGLPGT